MEETLKSFLKLHYNLSLISITPGPRQFVAKTYIAKDEFGIQYFIKQYPSGRDNQPVLSGLPILKKLHDWGFPYSNHPYPNREGQLSDYMEQSLIVVFNYFNAIHTLDYDLPSFGTILAKLHTYSLKDAKFDLPIELFDMWYLKKGPDLLKKVYSNSLTDSIVHQTQQLLQPYQSELKQDWEEFEVLRERCRSSKQAYVLTHGDPAGNILVDEKRSLYLVDWDDIKLAPAERDTWFMQDNPEFLEGYLQYFPKHQVSALFYSYYVLNRYWDDLFGYLENILSDKPDTIRRENLKDLEKNCLGWLRPLVRKTLNTKY